MADFIVAVFFFNLIFGILLFIVRRRIPITAPTLALTALISFTCTISFPYLAARLDYPGHAAVFLAIIILFAIILSFWDGRQPVPAGNTSRAEHNPSGSRENNDAQKRGAASISAAGQEHAGPKTVDAMPLSHGQETPVSEEQPAEQPVSTVTAINTAAPQVGQPAAAIAESAATDSGLEVEKAEAETPAVRLETAAETETESEPHAEPEGPAMEPKPAPEITAPEETAATKPPQETPHGEAEKAEAETPAVRLEAAAGTETGSEPHAEPEDPAVEPKPVPKITAPEETATTKPPQETPPGEAEAKESVPEEQPQNQEPPAHDTELQQLLAAGFASKQSGHYEKAIKLFKQALQMQPEPRLAILTLIEISEIYNTVGQHWQAAEILNILLQSWHCELDRDTIDRLEQKIEQLQGLFKQ